MHRKTWLALLGILALAQAAPAQEGGVPDWFVQQVREKTGVWITDNAAYLEADGGIEEYGIEWRPGIGGMSMTGRLFGRRGGEEIGTFWEFRMFWHPGLREVRAYQFGADGTVGIGSGAPPSKDGVEILEQTFYAPDGGESRVRHVTRVHGDREEGRSENWVDGEWRPRREYVWYRQH